MKRGGRQLTNVYVHKTSHGRPKTLSTFFARRFFERFEVKQTPFQGTVYDGVED